MWSAATRERSALSSANGVASAGRRRPALPQRAAQDLPQVVAGDHLLEALRARRRLVELAVERGVVRRLDGRHPVEVPRLEVPDARRPQIRGQVGPGAQDQPHVGRARTRVASPRSVALQHQRGDRVVGHRGEPDPLEPHAQERGGEQRGHILALEPLQAPALGRDQRHRPIDALDPGRVRVDERERRDRDPLRPRHARDRPRDQVEDRLRRAALVRLGEGERLLRDHADRAVPPELDQARPRLGAAPVHHHDPAPLPPGGLPREGLQHLERAGLPDQPARHLPGEIAGDGLERGRRRVEPGRRPGDQGAVGIGHGRHHTPGVTVL